MSKRGKNKVYRNGHRLTDRERRMKTSELIKELKESGCSICGYLRCIDALHFHHITNKRFEFSDLKGRSKESILKEAEKCLLVCSNCHAEIHMEERLKGVRIKEQISTSPDIIQMSLWN